MIVQVLNDVVTLITDKPVTTRGNTQWEILKVVEIFGNKKSVRAKEFYSAMASRIKVTDIIQIYKDDYEETIVRDNGKKYKPRLVKMGDDTYEIVRTYATDNQYMELTVVEVE